MSGLFDSKGDVPLQDAVDVFKTTEECGTGFLGVQPDRLAPSAQPATLLCKAEAPGGEPCGAEAAVKRVHYRYTAKLDRRLGEVQQVLSEAIYEIACPRCGWRTQVQKVERN